MVELHGFITLRESYEINDEENFGEILNKVNAEIKNLKYSSLQIKSVNGEHFIGFLSFTNHMSEDIKEMISFFGKVGKIAKGSYGLLYIHNDEDEDNYNYFIVHRLARGRVDVYKDNLLSPTVPVLEDEQ